MKAVKQLFACLLLFVLSLIFVVSSTRNQYSGMEVYQLENYHFSSLQKKFTDLLCGLFFW